MSCILKIKEGFGRFTNTERKLANYILENKEEVINLSVQELAEKAQVSPAGVVRFSKTIGYKGFISLKVSLAKEKDEELIDSCVIINEEDNINDVIRKVQSYNTSIINETIGLINIEFLNDAIEKISKANNIYLYGIGASGLVARDLQYKLLRINKNVIYQTDSHIQIASSVHMKSNDVAIGISYSGESKEVINPLRYAKENGVTTITITKYSKSTLSKLGDYVLYLANGEDDLRIGAITSRIAGLTLIDIIYLGIAKNNYKETCNDISKTREMVNSIK